jgi:predicted dienelactone hydrolase
MYELLTEGWSQVGMVESALVREADVLAMLSALEERAEMPDDGLFRAIDFEQIGMSGHSFGGLTTFLVACNEPRVRAMVPMTPVTSVVNILSPCALRDFTVPMMMMTAGLDGTLNTTREMRDPYRTFQMERYYVELLTAGHFSFSDICALDLEILANEVGISTGGALKDGCGPENMAIEDAHHLIRSFSIGFLNHQLRASPGSYEFYGPNAGLAASDHLLYSEGNFSR